MNLKGKIAIITGASVGYGVGIAEALKKEGCIVWITGRRENKLKKAARAGDKEAADLTYERHVSAAKTAGQTGKDLELTKAQARDSIDKFYKKSVQDFDKQIEKAKSRE